MYTTSPGRISCTAAPRRPTYPTPSVTYSVCPRGWVCHAVRAPGANRTCAHPMHDWSSGLRMVSMKTVPVNQASGPLTVWPPLLVNFMGCCPIVRSWTGEDREHARLAVILDLVDVLEERQVFIRELELDVCVGAHVRRVGRLGQGQQPQLEQVADGQLRNRDAVAVGDLRDLAVLEQLAMGDRRIGLDEHAV